MPLLAESESLLFTPSVIKPFDWVTTRGVLISYVWFCKDTNAPETLPLTVISPLPAFSIKAKFKAFILEFDVKAPA